ncbi:MAG: hypothetical protein AAF958_17375 [Planctomycetota bacterium]
MKLQNLSFGNLRFFGFTVALACPLLLASVVPSAAASENSAAASENSAAASENSAAAGENSAAAGEDIPAASKSKQASIAKDADAAKGLKQAAKTVAGDDQDAAKQRVADWFDSMDAGDLEVRIIQRDATRANILVTNKTGKDMLVRLPEQFASVPVLGQGMMGGMGGGGMGGMGGGGMGGMGGGGQGAGGGMGGMGGGGMGGMGGGGMGGGGFMSIKPEKTRKFAVTTVCLEHGKPDPNPRMKYKMVRMEEFSADPRIATVCKALGYGKLNQNAAQAAAWNIMDKLSWQELAMKNKVESRYTGNVRWFSPRELRAAQAAVMQANRLAAENATADHYADQD